MELAHRRSFNEARLKQRWRELKIDEPGALEIESDGYSEESVSLPGHRLDQRPATISRNIVLNLAPEIFLHILTAASDDDNINAPVTVSQVNLQLRKIVLGNPLL
ncbi:hypothetical protein FRB98_006295 [Tulasnella sp. 332]|nr:hypothetical protein FRB98_006295 [Tulasnella sp. 332]